MRHLSIVILILLLSPQISLAETEPDYTVIIDNPKEYSSDPLTVITKWRSNTGYEETIKYVWKPDSFTEFNLFEDSWVEDIKSYRTRWYAAYPRPFKKGFIVVKNISGYEEEAVEEIALIEESGGGGSNWLKVQCRASINHVYWSRDGKKLFVMCDEKPYDESYETVKIYDTYRRNLIATKPAKEVDRDKLIPIRDVDN